MALVPSSAPLYDRCREIEQWHGFLFVLIAKYRGVRDKAVDKKHGTEEPRRKGPRIVERT